AIIWADSRSSSELDELSELIGAEKLNRILMNRTFCNGY
ncbi:unnamed protein product, partial [marine sediment metagenome]